MRPKGKENPAKGRVEGFYATEAKRKTSKRVRRGVLCDRSEKKKEQKVA
jgi:hypothetical protein